MPNPRQWTPTKPRPSGEGRVLFIGREGNLVVRQWPRARGDAQDENTMQWARYFGAVNRCFRYLHPREIDGWLSTTYRGLLYPRDLYTATNLGRGFGFLLPDGRCIMPDRSRYDLSRTLDLFTRTPGGVLVRGPEGWEGLDGDLEGFVLTSNGPNAAPSWKPASGGGGSSLGWPFLEPCNPWTWTDTNGTLQETETVLGGYVASLLHTTGTARWAALRFTNSWNGERATICVDPYMGGVGAPVLSFRAVNAANTSAFAAALVTENNGVYRLQAGQSNSHNGNLSQLNGSAMDYHGPHFLALEREDAAWRVFAGQTPETMKQLYQGTLGTDKATFTTLQITLQVGAANYGQAGFRLIHSDIETEEIE